MMSQIIYLIALLSKRGARAQKRKNIFRDKVKSKWTQPKHEESAPSLFTRLPWQQNHTFEPISIFYLF